MLREAQFKDLKGVSKSANETDSKLNTNMTDDEIMAREMMDGQNNRDGGNDGD